MCIKERKNPHTCLAHKKQLLLAGNNMETGGVGAKRQKTFDKNGKCYLMYVSSAQEHFSAFSIKTCLVCVALLPIIHWQSSRPFVMKNKTENIFKRGALTSKVSFAQCANVARRLLTFQ